MFVHGLKSRHRWRPAKGLASMATFIDLCSSPLPSPPRSGEVIDLVSSPSPENRSPQVASGAGERALGKRGNKGRNAKNTNKDTEISDL